MSITVHGVVKLWSPQGWTVELDNGSAAICSSKKLEQKKIRISMNDEVDVELSEYDLGHGRIVWRRG